MSDLFAFLRDMKCNSYALTYNDHKSCYVSAKEEMERDAHLYSNVSAEERQRMIDSDTIWCLQVYPNTPVAFNVYYGSTLEACLNSAMADQVTP